MRFNKYIFLLALPAILISCDSLLEIEADGNISGDVLKDQASIETALNGAYYNLGGIHNGINGGELLGGDFKVIPMLLAHLNGKETTWDAVNAPSYTAFSDATGDDPITAINTRVESNWARAYETINMVNDIIKNIQKVSDGQARSKIEGEALAMRGILYFEMARLWGPQYSDDNLSVIVLPIVTDPILSVEDLGEVEYATLSAVYQQAISDLNDASSLLVALGKNGVSLSYYACQAYLSRIYMQMGEYSDAATAASNVINAGLYELEETPTDAFNNLTNSSEDIFAIQQTLANNAGDRSVGGGLTAFYSSLTESGLGLLGVLQSVFSSNFFPNSPQFPDEDLRARVDRSVTASTSSTAVDGAFYQNQNNELEELLSCAKFLSARNVIPVIRLAEVYLNRAESLFETNINVINPIALSDLNRVRNRAGLSVLQPSDFSDSFEFYDSIVIERKRELFLEGHLLHDLRRWRSQLDDPSIIIGSSLESTNPLSNNLLLPIPQAQRNAEGD